MITTVLLDVDDTIFDFKKSCASAIEKMFIKNGLPFNENTMEIYHAVCNPLWELVGQEKLTRTELRKIRWGMVFERLGIEANADGIENQYTKFLSNEHYLVPGADVLLEYLHGKYTVCIASNADYNQQNKRLCDSGLRKYVDKVFTSHEIGYDKPCTEFFDKCMDELQERERQNIMMIGDSLSADVMGGKRFGFKTCWYNPEKKDNNKIIADYEVEKLTDIMKIL